MDMNLFKAIVITFSKKYLPVVPFFDCAVVIFSEIGANSTSFLLVFMAMTYDQKI